MDIVVLLSSPGGMKAFDLMLIWLENTHPFPIIKIADLHLRFMFNKSLMKSNFYLDAFLQPSKFLLLLNVSLSMCFTKISVNLFYTSCLYFSFLISISYFENDPFESVCTFRPSLQCAWFFSLTFLIQVVIVNFCFISFIF